MESQDHFNESSTTAANVQIGKGRVRREGADVALVGYGAMVSACLAATDMLAQQGVSATVVDARFCKPLDVELLRQVPRFGLFQ